MGGTASSGRPRLAAYILLADPSFLVESVSAYYPYVDRIVVSYDDAATSWTGTPLPIPLCLDLLRGLDTEGKLVAAPGHFARLDEDPLANDTHQRQHALDAASEFGDWVVQLDTDEVMLRPATFFDCLRRGAERGARGLDFPARWLYSRVAPGRYLEQTDRMWRHASSYPGPLAVAAGTTLRLARQADVPLHRVDVRSRNTDPWHPDTAEVHEVIPVDEAVAHFSWVRHPDVLRRKFAWSGHSAEWSAPGIHAAWERRSRHPWLTVATTPLRRRSRAWYRLSSIPEPPGGEPPDFETGPGPAATDDPR